MTLPLLLCLALASERTLVDRVVAVVNEDVVTLSELEKTASPLIAAADPEKKKDVYQRALDELIADKLIQQQVREARLEVTADDVERTIDDICHQNNLSRDELKQAIEARGMSMSQYRQDLEHQLIRLKLIELKVRSRIVVSDADVRADWEHSVAAEKRERMVKLRHLFFNWGDSPDANRKKQTLARAAKARDRIVGGEKFAEVAKQVSEGPTATEGGDLGWLSDTGLLPELARVVMKLQVGEVSPPIETPNGVHVVVVEDTKVKEPTGFESARMQIYQRLYQQESDRQMRLWIDELRAQSSVIIRWP